MRLVLVLLLLAAFLHGAGNLDIYVIDVEGGKSVLIVSPTGESMVVDAGWPTSNNRVSSTERIVEAAKAAGLKQIDYLVISHFDVDHAGDVTELTSKFPVRRILDHGVLPARLASYSAAREKLNPLVLEPGDKAPIKGINVHVVSAAGNLIRKPLKGAGAKNDLCANYPQAAAIERDIEDDRSIGVVIEYGKFRMLDLADLEAHLSHDLVCPVNLIGPVSVYNLNVHGQFKGVAPEMVGSLNTPVIIQANGARKGADAETWPILRDTPGKPDIWQVHESLNAGKENNPPPDFIANLDGAPDQFKWIKISAKSDGTFTITNTRNGFSKQYGSPQKSRR
jgi:hypothetical protein